IVVRAEIAFGADVETERRATVPLAHASLGGDPFTSVLAFDFGFEFGKCRGDGEKCSRVRVALLRIEVDTHVENVESDITLVDEPLDGGGEISYRAGDSRDFRGDHALDVTVLDRRHEFTIAITVGVDP